MVRLIRSPHCQKRLPKMSSRRAQNGSKNISIRDAIYIGTLILGMGTTWGIFSSRISNTEAAIKAMEPIASRQPALELSIRTLEQRYDKEVVPRQEHLQMNAVLEQRLQSIIDNQKRTDEQMNSVQSKLDQLMTRSVR